MLPFLSLALAEGFQPAKNTGALKRYAVFILILSLIIAGTAFYFTGRNFQSIPYSLRVAEYQFLLEQKDARVEVDVFNYYTIYKYNARSYCCPREFLLISKPGEIQALYYLTGNFDELQEMVRSLIENNSFIYSNPTSYVLICTYI